jgi:DNA-binding MarR family transcriptional regulator
MRDRTSITIDLDTGDRARAAEIERRVTRRVSEINGDYSPAACRCSRAVEPSLEISRERGLAVSANRERVLGALALARQVLSKASINAMVVFLHVCEREGLSMRELRDLTGMSDPMISRTSRGLVSRGSPGALAPALGWLDVRVDPADRRSRTLHLTALGAELRDRFDDWSCTAGEIRRAPDNSGADMLGSPDGAEHSVDA